VTRVARWLLDLAFASPPQSGLAWFCFLFPLKSSRRFRQLFLPICDLARIGFVQCALTEIGRPHPDSGLCVSHEWASVRTSLTLGRHSSEIRTGCANEPPSGSVRGHQATGVPTTIDSYPSETPPNP